MKNLSLRISILLLIYSNAFAQTDAINIIPSGNVGVGTTTPGQKLEVGGNIKLDDNMMVEGTSVYRVFRNLATYNSSTGGAAGAFVINTTMPWNSAYMFRVKVEGYFYDATSPFETTIGGYMYTANNFFNYGYVNVGGNNLAVRFARRVATNTVAIILGAEGSSYSYPKLSVTSFMQGHSTPNETHADGWVISQITSLTGYDFVVSVPNVTTLPSGSGNYIQNQTAADQAAGFRINGNGLFNGGSVGIGTISPTQRLSVAGNINKTGSWIAGDAVWGANTFEIHNSSWDGISNNNYGGITGGHGYYYGGLQSGGGGGNEAASGELYVAGKSMLIGSVGVGTPTPFDKVQVVGRIRFGTNDVSYLNAGAGAVAGAPSHGIGWGNQPLNEYGIYVGPQETINSGNYTKLVLNWHTGIKIGADISYGGIQFYNNSMYVNPAELMSIGKGDNHVRVVNNLYVGAYGGHNSAPTSYGSLGLIQAKNGYYGLLMGQGVSNPNLMFDGAGNGGIYYENWGWSQYYLTGTRHLNINTASDLGASLGISGTLAVVDGTQGAGKVLTSNAAGVATWTAPGSIGAGDNLGNHSATTTLTMNGNNINTVNDIYAVNNYGTGLVGVYDSYRYQNVWAMGTSWRLAANGTTPGNLYGLAWTHTNVGGQSKAGLSHQMLIMENGITKVALGSGIWTNYTSYIPFIYDTDNTGYYLDPAGTSRLSTIYCGDVYNDLGGWFRNYNTTGLYNQSYGNHWYATGGNYWNIGGNAGTNTGIVFRSSFQGAIQGYVYSDGSGFGLLHSGGGWALRTTTGVTEAYQPFYASTSYIPFIYDRDNTGYYMDPNSTSRMYYGDYNYLHTQVNDSWFPYTGNNWNYFRGNSYITNAHWYDENNGGYYFNVDNTSRMAYLYHGIGAYNVGGWTSGRIQTESANDGHQYHPVSGNWGFIGTSGQYWYYMYSNNFIDVSRRDTKRNIIPVENKLADLVMDDIDKIKPSFYKYKLETDELEKGNEPKYRPNMHLGVILDESPDYLQDQAFSGIDIYAMATMGIVGVKHNREEIKQIKEAIGLSDKKMTINDFGNDEMKANETWVAFSEEFIQKNSSAVSPIVTVTPNQAGVSLSVTETSAKGFKVATREKDGTITFNWIAMAKVPVRVSGADEAVPAALNAQLKVDESRKAPIKAYWDEQKRIGQEEHARQAEEHIRVVEFGKKNYMETVNPESKKPAIGEYIPVDANSTIKEESFSKEGAPKQGELTPTPSNPEVVQPPAAEVPAAEIK